MATGDEILGALAELRETIGSAHTARRDLRDAIKDAKKLVPDEVHREVERLVLVIADQVRDELHREAGLMIDRIEQEWRSKLGLDPR